MADDNRWSDRDRDWRDDRTRTEPGAPRGGYREREDGWRGGGYGARDYGDGGRDSPGYNPAGPAQDSRYGGGRQDGGYGEEQYRRQLYGNDRDHRAARTYQELDESYRGGGERPGGGAYGYPDRGYRSGSAGPGYGRGYSETRAFGGPRAGYNDYAYGPYTPYGAVTEGETSTDYHRPAGQDYRGAEGRYGDRPWRGDSGRGGGHRRGSEERSWLERTGEKLGHFVRDLGDEFRGGDYRGGEHRGRGPKGYARSDDRIRDDVSDRLTDDPYVDASDIEVLVSGGEVTLSGTVPIRDWKRRAEDIAESVGGVRHVQNNLRVEAGKVTDGDNVITEGQAVIPEA